MRLITLAIFLISISTFAKMEEVVNFGQNPGNLGFYLYAPDTITKNTNILVLNHGCTQNAKDYSKESGWLKVAEERRFIIVAPEQRIENNDKLCLRWFEKDHFKANSGEQKSIISMINFVKTKYNLDSNTFVTGISAGGATTSNLIGNYPDLFSAAAIVAGVHYRCADSLNSAIACMFTPSLETYYSLRKKVSITNLNKVPRVMVIHGMVDKTVNIINETNTVTQWLSVHKEEAQLFNFMNWSYYPNRIEKNFYKESEHIVKSVTFYTLGHAQPIDEKNGCGSENEYIEDNGYCASKEIANFFNL